MNSAADTPTPVPVSTSAIRLRIRGAGHVPSMKNGKELFVTNARTRAWMKKVAADIESQLRCAFQIEGGGMQTTRSPLAWTLCSLPLDDSLTWIGVPCGSWRVVKKGDEGADILIERLE